MQGAGLRRHHQLLRVGNYSLWDWYSVRRERVLGLGKKGRLLVPLEQDEQIALFEWSAAFESRHPELKLLFHIANSAGRLSNFRYAGVKRGVLDLCLPVARGGYHGLFIELKRRKGGKISLEQSWWIDHLFAQGYLCDVCYGWDEARETLLKYLSGKSLNHVSLPDPS